MNTAAFDKGITVYLEPVIEDLAPVRDSYNSAHADVVAAHDNQTPGWFGGEGNGEIRPASSSFLNEAAWQLQRLAADQAELYTSLQEYEAFLRAQIQWVKDIEAKNATLFRDIERELLDGREW